MQSSKELLKKTIYILVSYPFFNVGQVLLLSCDYCVKFIIRLIKIKMTLKFIYANLIHDWKCLQNINNKIFGPFGNYLEQD